MKLRRTCLIGMFPPPLHGMSLINEYLRNQILEHTVPLVIDYSPRNLNRSIAVRFGKVFRVLRCCLQLSGYLIQGRVGLVYLGLSGGNGQAYDALFAGISRLFGRQLFLHHHSYQYLIHRRMLSKLLFATSGKGAIHIVACEKMAQDLRMMYPTVSEVRVISGIAALPAWENDVIPRKQVRSVGFLSNISIEKGVLEFLEVAAWAESTGWPIRFLLAGPYHDSEVESMVKERLKRLGNVTYLGALYGPDKLHFFDTIDIFLLPSHNESEGLVIHEAMGRGVPVIAYSRGCIEQIVSDSVGARLAPADDYVAGAIAKISKWLLEPEAFHLASQTASRQYSEARAIHGERMDDLCMELISGKLN